MTRNTAHLTVTGPYPPPAVVDKPNPEPVFPAGFDTFAPPVNTAVPSSSAPVLTTLTPPVGKPDDTLILMGERLSAFTGSDAGKDVAFNIYGQTNSSNATEGSGLLQRLNGREAGVTIPTTLPANSMYMVWPRNAGGYGRPMMVNRTEAWWLEMNARVTRGSSIAVYGRNLSSGAATPTSNVYIQSVASGAGQWATVTSVNPYRVAFTLPTITTALPNGAYKVWVHNTHGGSYGWSSPPDLLNVGDPLPSSGQTFEVTAFGADPVDANNDDTPALTAALQAVSDYHAANPGLLASIHLPAGTYLITHGFGATPNTRWYGDGKDSTFIRCTTGFDTPPATAQNLGVFITNGGTFSNFEISNLTIDANNHISPGGEGNANQGVVLFLGNTSPPATDVRLLNVRIQTQVAGVSAAFLDNLNGVTVQGSEIHNDIRLISSRQVKLSGNSFRGNHYLNQFVQAANMSQLSVLGNTFQDDDINSPSTGQAQGRVIAGNGLWGSQRNIYFGDNTTIDLGVNLGFGANRQNTGEQIMYEGQETWYQGFPSTAAGPNDVTFTGLPMDYTGYFLSAAIVDGPGMGQYREISAFNPATGTFTVTPPWVLPPSTTSKVRIGSGAERLVVYHNTMDGKNDYARWTASAVMAPFGGCFDWIADSNTATDMHIAFAHFAVQQNADTNRGRVNSMQPIWNNYVANNVTNRCNTAIIASAPEVNSDTQFEGVSFVGNVWRNNKFTDIVAGPSGPGSDPTEGAIYLYGYRENLPDSPMHMNVWERNTLTNVPAGVNAGVNTTGEVVNATDLLFYKNSFVLGTAALAGSYGFKFGPIQNPDLQQNSWSGFETTYTGTAPGPVLEVPQRQVVLNAVPNGHNVGSTVAVWNAGTAPLTWSASDDATWLTLSPTSGTITDQGALPSVVNLTANPTGLTAGTSATITFTAGSQTVRVTVTLAVSSAAGLPTPWITQDIGSGLQAGGAGYSNGVFTLEGAGGPAAAGDNFRFVHQPSNGDCSISARVRPGATGGVMIREGTGSTTKAVYLQVLPTGAITLSSRAAAGGTATVTTKSTSARWVRLVRTGNTFAASYSTDRASDGGPASWTLLSSPSVSMASSARMGLLVGSTAKSVLSTAFISNVSATP